MKSPEVSKAITLKADKAFFRGVLISTGAREGKGNRNGKGNKRNVGVGTDA